MASERSSTASSQQAGNGLANKLARIAWSILRNEKTFDISRHEAMAI